MSGIQQWGLEFVRAVQSVFDSPIMTIIMKGVSLLGTEYFFLTALPFMFWCVDERKGARLGFVVFFSSFLNGTLKELWAQPRPYELDPGVGKALETTHGLPSFHAQSSLTFWGTLAIWLKKPLGILLAVFFPLIIGLSRIYLGVHFPTDVFAGWALGLAIVLLYRFFGERIEAELKKLEIRFQVMIVAALTLIGNAVYVDDTSIAGAFFGIGVGYAFMQRNIRFSAEGGIAKKAIRLGLGMLVAVAIYAGLKAVLPRAGENLYALFRFARYTLLGFWVSFGAPWLFIKLKLADARSPEAPAIEATEAKG